jgi:amino acid transporter, AAT family
LCLADVISLDGGTESIAITAGETKDPARNMPRVVKNVFWRILLFYVLSVLVIGLNVAYTYPGLSSKNTRTSPFTIVFQMAGSKGAGSFINAVIMTSVLSAGNHALFAGTRLLYSLAVDRHAPAFLGKLNKNKVPWVATLATAMISGLCFASSFIGAGQLWTWLQKYQFLLFTQRNNNADFSQHRWSLKPALLDCYRLHIPPSPFCTRSPR